MNETLPTSADQMQDILDIESVLASPWIGILKALLWTLVIAASVFLLWRVYKFVKRRFFSTIKILSPREQALTALDHLKASRHFAERNWPAVYFALSEAFKRYATDGCGWDILEHTTEEILASHPDLESIGGQRVFDEAKLFLQRGDMSKFAKVAAIPEQVVRDFAFVKNFVTTASEKRKSQAGESA